LSIVPALTPSSFPDVDRLSAKYTEKWMESVTDIAFSGADFQSSLKDGQILCILGTYGVIYEERWC
jgi:hypothetical protein